MEYLIVPFIVIPALVGLIILLTKARKGFSKKAEKKQAKEQLCSYCGELLGRESITKYLVITQTKTLIPGDIVSTLNFDVGVNIECQHCGKEDYKTIYLQIKDRGSKTENTYALEDRIADYFEKKLKYEA